MTYLYTIGTWRVGRPAYLDQLSKLKVYRLIDVRGNPRAGRQEDLKRSKQLEAALWSAGITYEYWGGHLGEDALEDRTPELQRALSQLVRSVHAGGVCLLGHLHEPSGCHRLQLCDELAKLAPELAIKHLLWKDHLVVRETDHGEVSAERAAVLDFFNDRWMRAEASRKKRASTTEISTLPTVNWKDFDPGMFADEKARRFLLPFDTDLLWYPHWLSKEGADELKDTVFGNITFLHPTYVFQDPDGSFTNTLIKRGQVRICGDDCPGALGAEPLQPWSEALIRRVEDAAGTAFNCFVANHYADGRVVINWHSDSGPGDDEGLGPNPRIGSVSLGARRTFSLKSKRAVDGRMVHLDVPLTHGSLLIMGKNSQTHWLHALPADEYCKEERVNLTFRFFARESTKHIEGVEHNHEWEAAAGSVRVLLHRGRCGRPVHADVPGGVTAARLPGFLSTVLPGRRGHADVSVRGGSGEWRRVPPSDLMVDVLRTATAKGGGRPEVRIEFDSPSDRGKGGEQSAPPKDGCTGDGKGRGKRHPATPLMSGGRWRQQEADEETGAGHGRRWNRGAAKGKGKGGSDRLAGA